jgi:predicted short-subunit dehydrogenase-like oxidoreductase (DUF2520 family)
MNAPAATPPVTHDVFIVGAGRAGLALARALMRANHRIIGTWSRTPEAAARVRVVTQAPAFHGRIPQVARSASLVLLGVTDDALQAVARNLVKERLVGEGQVVAHLAGALDSAVIAPVRKLGAAAGSLHPVASFSEGSVLPVGARFAVEGDDRSVEVLRSLALSLGGEVVVVAPGQKPRYHAALVFAANYLVVLVGVAQDLLRTAGVPEEDTLKMLVPLVEGTARNLGREGLTRALTGPITRGDANTIRLHLDALKSDRSVARLYAELGRRALHLAEAQGLPRAELDAMEVILAHHLEH